MAVLGLQSHLKESGTVLSAQALRRKAVDGCNHGHYCRYYPMGQFVHPELIISVANSRVLLKYSQPMIDCHMQSPLPLNTNCMGVAELKSGRSTATNMIVLLSHPRFVSEGEKMHW